jgi:mRNA-degrading endonuclease RelE of RelBE toxin-antitoxin system
MMNKPTISVGYASQFKRDLKHLSKKYRHVRDDILSLVKQLQSGETPGNQVRGTGYTVYKTRLRSSDLAKGKSGSYRVIYYIKTPERVILVMLYIKTERADVSSSDIRQLIDDLESPPSL